MENEQERLRTKAETSRQSHERQRQANERARDVAEASRVVAEDERRANSLEVSDTVATMSHILKRMETVEALRRDARKDPDKQDR